MAAAQIWKPGPIILNSLALPRPFRYRARILPPRLSVIVRLWLWYF